MGVKLIVDSTCDCDYSKISDVATVLPIAVIFDNKEYLPGINLTNEEFYQKLSVCKKLPKTSQVPLSLFIKTMKGILNDGDDVVGIFIASKLSGTFNSAHLAKEEIGSDRIFLIDSQTVTFPYGALVYEAAKMVRENKTAQEIYDRINYLVPRIKIYAMIDNLKYLKMGGRISGTLAVLGNFLNFKPIINIENGVLGEVGKKRGLKNAYKYIAEIVNNSDVDTSLPCYLGDTNDKEKAEQLKKVIYQETKLRPEISMDIGASVGTHAGPGSTGIAFFIK